jgi:hypothetical protein
MCTESPMWVLCVDWLFLWWRKVCRDSYQCGCSNTMKECEILQFVFLNCVEQDTVGYSIYTG